MISLLEAFQSLSPPPADAPSRVRAASQAQAELLFSAAKAATAGIDRFGLDDDERITCICVVVRRLYAAGPRGVRESDPDSDDRVTGYLHDAVRNGLLDALRKRKRGKRATTLDSAGVDQGIVGAFQAAEVEDSEPNERDVLVTRATELVFKDIVPAIADARASKSPAAGAEFAELVELLRREVAEEGSIFTLAAARVAVRPITLSAAVLNRLAELGYGLDAAAVSVLVSQGYQVPANVPPWRSGPVLGGDELIAAVRSAAADVERVNLDTRAKNYRAAIIAEVDRRVEANRLSPEDADVARQVVRYSLQFTQKKTDRVTTAAR